MRPLHLLLAVLVLVPVIRETSRASDETWPQFRGPTGRGHTDAPVPTSWQPGSVAWSVDLPAAGQSSPTVWGDRIYLTGASDEGAKRHVFCLSRDEGTLLWSREIPCANPEETHKMNTRATPTVATDGTHVVAFFGPGGLHCFNTEGETMWSLAHAHADDGAGAAEVRACLETSREAGPTEFQRQMGWVLTALGNAVHRLWIGQPLEPAVIETVMAGGDTDTTAAIWGALWGARHGPAELPAHLLDRLAPGPFGKAHLRALARAVAQGTPPPRFSTVGALLRNLALYPVVLGHGLLRLMR